MRVAHGTTEQGVVGPIDSRSVVLERRILQVCDAVGAFIEYWGYKRIHGRVWALLALHRDPLSQRDIARQLGLSRSSVSETIQELGDWGLVRPLNQHRLSPYRAVVDIWPTVADILRRREWMLMEGAKTALEGALEECDAVRTSTNGTSRTGSKVRPSHPYDEERLRMLLGMTELFQSLLRTLISLRVPKAGPGLTRGLGRAAQLLKNFRSS